MNKTSILIVEDDRPIRNLIVTTLKTHEYKYLTAENGREAILEASSHNPDIILLDLGLPDMEGVDVIKKIRTWSNMPIIVISARSEDSDKIEALDAGADDYITKPFSVEELLARIRVTQRRLAVIQTGEIQKTAVFINGELKIDYTAGCTYMRGEELHLTPIEYKLLCLLSRNVGKVLTHTYITQQIWGRSSENDVASLRVFMATLRKKLESDKNEIQYLYKYDQFPAYTGIQPHRITVLTFESALPLLFCTPRLQSPVRSSDVHQTDPVPAGSGPPRFQTREHHFPYNWY